MTKPTIKEQIGVALSSKNLVMRSHETGLERIAALGAAALAIRYGADRAGLTVAAMQPEVVTRSAGMRTLLESPPSTPDPQDVITSELAPMLWRIYFGGQLEFVPRASELFALWCTYRHRFAAMPEAERAQRLPRLAARSLHEWLSDRCPACKRSGKQEILRTGQRVTPRGSMQRNAVFRPCVACGGTGRVRQSAGERARHLGLDHATFDREKWAYHLRACMIWLRRILMSRPYRPLTLQLERRTKHP